MRILTTLCLIVVFSDIFAANAFDSSNQPESLYANLTVAQAKDTISYHLNDPRFVILDIRTSSEYNSKHLEQAVNIDYYSTDFSERLSEFDKSKVYLIYCASGNRSGKAFILMQEMNFQTVYNMTGGMGSWLSANYPTTTYSSPLLALMSDSLVHFNNTSTHKTDSVKVTITNGANELLTISTITDLSGTAFSTNFDRNITLSGGLDYSFNIYYTPVNSLNDSVIFNIQSNGGSIFIILKGTAIYPAKNQREINPVISIINDSYNRQIIINPKLPDNKTFFYLYDTSGKMIISTNQMNGNIINYSNLKNGVYILQFVTEGVSQIYKLPIFSK